MHAIGSSLRVMGGVRIMKTTQEIETRTDKLLEEIAWLGKNSTPLTPVSDAAYVLAKHAELSVLTARLNEISSRRLIRLTRWIIALTWIIAVLTVGIFLLEFRQKSVSVNQNPSTHREISNTEYQNTVVNHKSP
jgi:hypothetical protein